MKHDRECDQHQRRLVEDQNLDRVERFFEGMNGGADGVLEEDQDQENADGDPEVRAGLKGEGRARFWSCASVIVNTEHADTQQRRNRRAGYRGDRGRDLLATGQNVDGAFLFGCHGQGQEQWKDDAN
jgi:hypothetical protein